MNRQEIGVLGEEVARSFLSNNGFEILETNYRCREGEVDIVALSGNELVFVEVRTKTSTGYGSPEESVTCKKMKALRSVAEHYIQNHTGLPEDYRIDFIGVRMAGNGRLNRIEHIENAVGGD